MGDSNTNKKCFIVAFGVEHLAGRDDFNKNSLLHPSLFDSSEEKWMCPPNTKTTNTNIQNVFFVQGDTSETELSIFYRERIEVALSDCSKEYIRKNVSLYVKEVSDDKDAMRF